MKLLKQFRLVGGGAAIIGVSCLGFAGSIVRAVDNNSAATHAAAETAAQQQRVQEIITKGSQEISRRLTSLSALSAKISNAAKLSANDKNYLSGEVTSTVNGLTALQTSLKAQTTVTGAHTDAVGIIDNYRVYALVLPKVSLVRVADDQQVIEAKLTALAQKLQTRLDTAKSKAKDVASLQTQLNDMVTQISTAQAISSSIQQKVLLLQPTDYNNDHTVLSGDHSQLETARTHIKAAYGDAKNIVDALKTL